ncbi:GNAT family N-acetyltransferase [Roseomonas eburnea]|uniref:GNAT family N-acetyltransferase n=1 Tax=Neoroseomonas eburnea TaxID=1346889 RepID=A0A9X9XJW3_9PROT|nr:GNAT family N-acetyltransferase [Neoroseomonas eburnea]
MDTGTSGTLIRPRREALGEYVAALESGWSPANVAGDAVVRAHLAAIGRDADAFLESLHDPEARGAPIALPDGTNVPRLPGYTRWIWDGGFCGAVHFRWQPGTAALPSHVLGHVGYAVVPWKRGRGHARRALALLLPEARAVGLPHVDLTTDPENIASQRVILAQGGYLVERFRKDAAYGGQEGLLFRIPL